MTSVHGLHHVTALAADPQRNVDFYAGALGLRLVKKTVNFDDPSTYHLYYGDDIGRPGTIITFFPTERALQGQQGSGQAAEIAFAIAPSSIGYWMHRLIERGVPYERAQRFGEQTLTFKDPDGLLLELAADPADAGPNSALAGFGVPAEHAIRRIHTVALWLERRDETAELLTTRMGFRPIGEDDGRLRYAAGNGRSGAQVDLRSVPGFWRGATGAGTVHHIAFRVPGDEEQSAIREALASDGVQVTTVKDRNYFRSIYFREPGGVLFEIATDVPGFAVDEPEDALGRQLKLPEWLEHRRATIEGRLPPVVLPETTRV